LISVDDHVLERPDVWTSRLSSDRWGERIPHLQAGHDGVETWMVDGQPLDLDGLAPVGALLPDRAQRVTRWSEVPQAAYEPAARLQAMDADGIEASVLYPTVAGIAGETFGRITDGELELACVQAYNDWLIDEWAAASPRFIPQCIVPIWPPEATVSEIRRAVGRGHRGVVFPSVPMELREVPHVNEPDYDPVWSICEELGVPLCLHAGASQAIQVPVPAGFSTARAAAFQSVTRQASSISILVHLLISRILMRHPSLKVVFSESSLSWGAYQVEFADQQFKEDGLMLEGYDLKPSEMFQRQCYFTGWYGRAGIETRDIIGIENIMWGTNFPRSTSTWPHTQDELAEALRGVPEPERDRILFKNAAELYKV
jgi:predicted TIM-barrel fold metal-dependent hydrolase